MEKIKPIPKIKKLLAENSGFTLVEILVSIAIFSLAMLVILQLFFYSLRAQRFLTAHSQLINEMSYNIEHISRGLRMAKKSENVSCLSVASLNFEKTTHVVNGNTTYGIKFQTLNPSGGVECVEYYLGQPAGYPAGVTALMENRTGAAGSFDLPLTSPKINILEFTVADQGSSQDDALQPRVTLYIQAQNREDEILENQITVSQRDPDIRE